MNVTQDLSILHLILQASAVVQVVMAILVGVSLMSWYYIFMKLFAVKQARQKTETFERDFWSGGNLNNLYNSAVNDRHHAGSMERIFEAGFREFTKLKGQANLDLSGVMGLDGLHRLEGNLQGRAKGLEALTNGLTRRGGLDLGGLFGKMGGGQGLPGRGDRTADGAAVAGRWHAGHQL